MGELLVGLNSVDGEDDFAAGSFDAKSDFSWRPKLLFRDCLSTMVSSNDGCPTMAAEAILQVVTSILSDEDQLSNHFQSRPGKTYN